MDASPATETINDEWCIEHFDHLSPELAADLHTTLARTRSLCPVTHSDQYDGFWVVTDYDDVLRVAQDWGTFSSAHGLTVPVAPIAVRNIPVELDPPLHREYKRLINAYFTAAVVAQWEDRTRRLVTRLDRRLRRRRPVRLHGRVRAAVPGVVVLRSRAERAARRHRARHLPRVEGGDPQRSRGRRLLGRALRVDPELRRPAPPGAAAGRRRRRGAARGDRGTARSPTRRSSARSSCSCSAGSRPPPARSGR